MHIHMTHDLRDKTRDLFATYGPGLALTCGIALAAFGAEAIELQLFGTAKLECIVLAIVFGAVFRSSIPLPERFQPGVDFAAKTLLEIAIVLLGSSISVQALQVAGGNLVLAIVGLVVLAIVVGYAIARLLGLHHTLAMLVACGNAICGNSAIAAVAPVIRAKADDVAASIAFTAVLGVVVVLLLPFAMPLFSMEAAQYGTLAGLTVYAVPQVLAAAHSGGVVAVQTGTLVKLVRVMMLGPVLFALGLLTARQDNAGQAAQGTVVRVPLKRLVPWFVIGFAVMVSLNSAGVIPQLAVERMSDL